jgi:hypothetical protein
MLTYVPFTYVDLCWLMFPLHMLTYVDLCSLYICWLMFRLHMLTYVPFTYVDLCSLYICWLMLTYVDFTYVPLCGLYLCWLMSPYVDLCSLYICSLYLFLLPWLSSLFLIRAVNLVAFTPHVTHFYSILDDTLYSISFLRPFLAQQKDSNGNLKFIFERQQEVNREYVLMATRRMCKTIRMLLWNVSNTFIMLLIRRRVTGIWSLLSTTARLHTMSVEGTFNEHSVSIQGTFSVHSGNIQWTLREHSVSIQGTFSEHSGNIQCPLSEHWVNTEWSLLWPIGGE